MSQEQMPKQASTKQLNCFIIMPFSGIEFKNKKNETVKLDENDLTHIYKELFYKSVNSYSNNNVSFINIHRNNTERGNFVKEIVGKLQDYDLVIADLTGFNPNVFYELGIRHTLKNGTIMLIQNLANLPSDLGNYINFEYEYPKNTTEFLSYYPEFERKMHELIDDVVIEKHKIDNPVRDFIGNRKIFRNEERIKQIEGNIDITCFLILNYIKSISSFLRNFVNWEKSETSNLVENFSISAKSFFNRIIIQNENIQVIFFLDSILMSFQMIHYYNKFRIENQMIINDVVVFIRNTPYVISDYNLVSYHLNDLRKYYKNIETSDDANAFIEYEDDNEDKTNCILVSQDEPIVKSFQFFINEWKKELKELTGEEIQ